MVFLRPSFPLPLLLLWVEKLKEGRIRDGEGDINQIRLAPFFGLACVGSFDGACNLGSLLKRRPSAKR